VADNRDQALDQPRQDWPQVRISVRVHLRQGWIGLLWLQILVVLEFVSPLEAVVRFGPRGVLRFIRLPWQRFRRFLCWRRLDLDAVKHIEYGQLIALEFFGAMGDRGKQPIAFDIFFGDAIRVLLQKIPMKWPITEWNTLERSPTGMPSRTILLK
jgi:hypothetical protein